MKKREIILIVSLVLGWQTSGAQLVINELMQSNIDCIMDDLNDFPDSWVELYNTGSAVVSLKDYRLGQSNQAGEAWKLSDVKVPPKQYALVYCDKVGKAMHTNFRLDSGKGCEVYLFKESEVIDQVTALPKQPAPNIAYGRKTDGDSEWGYQQKPTPGLANCGQTTDRILDSPVFSKAGGVFKTGNSFTLELSLPEGAPEETVIRMTTDGSEPTENSQTYTQPVNISGTKVVRAKLFCNGWLSPRSTAQSYLYLPREQTLPVVSILTDKRYLEDPKIGIYVEGSYKAGKKNYEYDWWRPLNIELFETGGGESVINQLCEARIMGNASRGAKRKSLALYAHKRFGKKHFVHEFFPDQKPGITKQKSILLRNAGNDFDYLYMRDAVIQRSMATNVDLDWQAWCPVIIFINGEYQGMLNIRERSNEDNVWANYDGLEDIDMIENWGSLKEGEWKNFNDFKTFYNEQGHTLQEYAQLMDWEEFINLMIMNLYFNNLDFPGNNIMMWRPRSADGRWRWIAKDTDFGLGLYDSPAEYKSFEWLYNPKYDKDHDWGANSKESTLLFRQLMKDADFYREFIDRCCIYMGDFLNQQGVRKIWDPMYERINTEYPHHRELINKWWPKYSTELASARTWLQKRTSIFYQQLSDYYKLGTPIPLSINQGMDIAPEMSLRFNGVALSGGNFAGKFFVGHNVSLEGQAPEGKEIKGWRVVTISSSGPQESLTDGPTCSFTMPECYSVAINAIFGEASAISSKPSHNWTWHRDGAQLYLSGVPEGTTVRLYDLRGMMIRSVVSDGSEIVLPLGSSQFHILKVGEITVKF